MSIETPKPPKTLARRPRGLGDRGPAELAATEAMLNTIREVYARYGFDALETPFLEYTDALGKFLPDQDRPNAGVFSLKDDDEQWLSLRYDLTAPLARYCAENWQNLAKPFRSYRAGWVFRNEKPGPGRFRQFMQFDADTVGASSVAADAEICMMAADTLEALGIPRGQYVIKVNNRKILDGMLEMFGLSGSDQAAKRLTVLRAIDKLDKFSWSEIEKLLGEGRLDESGDFTKGAGLTAEQIDYIYRCIVIAPTEIDGVTTLGPEGSIGLRYLLANLHRNQTFDDGVTELVEIDTLVRAAGYGPDRIRIDPSVVRGLEYYTGPVFEAELLFDTKDETGKPIRFGSVGGGGRYDGLVSRFLDEPVPATGFSIGVSRLLAALQALGKVNTAPQPGPVIVLTLDKTGEAMANYQKIVAELRSAKIRAEMYLGDAGMKAQLKYADRRGSTIAIIQGSNEREKGEVQIKDLVLGANLSATKDRAEYLEKQALAQFCVPVEQVVEAVIRVQKRQLNAID
jgi:histidyl-tRNA synthetase